MLTTIALKLTLCLLLLPPSLDAHYEIRFPSEALNAHVVFHPLMPLNVTALTLSFQVRMERLTGYPFLVSYAVRDQPNEFAVWAPGNEKNKHYGVIVGGNQFGVKRKTGFPTNDETGGAWIPILITWDGIKGDVQLTVNDTRYFPEEHVYKDHFRMRLRGGGKLVFGQELDHFDELEFDANQRFIGSIRRVKMWSRALSDAEIKTFLRDASAGIQYPLPADLVDFPLVRLEEGALVSGRVARCGGNDEGFGFEGQSLNPPSSGEFLGEVACKQACENITWAKAWSLTSRSHAVGMCLCYKTVTNLLIRADYRTGLICDCKMEHLHSIVARLPNTELLESMTQEKVLDHKRAFGKCSIGFEPFNGDKVVFECLPTTMWDASPNWKLRNITRCVKTCPDKNELPVPYQCLRWSDCTNGNRAGSECHVKPLRGHFAVGKLRCRSDGSWDASSVTCKEILCSPTPPPPSRWTACWMFEKCTKGNSIGSQCKAVGHIGYHPVGFVECVEEYNGGRWREVNVYCTQIRCVQPPMVEDCITLSGASAISCSNFSYIGSVCTARPYFIGKDYWGSFVSGFLRCEADGQWHNEEMTCHRGVYKNNIYWGLGILAVFSTVVTFMTFYWRSFKKRQSRARSHVVRSRRRHARPPNVDTRESPEALNPINTVSENVHFSLYPPSYENAIFGPPPSYTLEKPEEPGDQQDPPPAYQPASVSPTPADSLNDAPEAITSDSTISIVEGATQLMATPTGNGSTIQHPTENSAGN